MDITQTRTDAFGLKWIVLIPLMLVLFISTLDQTIVVTALDRIGSTLGNEALAPWVATAYLLTSAVTTLILGKLGDMYGRKPVLQWSIAIFVGASALCAVAPGMYWLIGVRALQGIGGGGLNSLVMAIVADLVTSRERARYQAILGIVPALAVVAGPLLGGLIVDHFTWQWIFLLNVPFGLAAFLLIAVRLDLDRRSSPHRIDYAGGVLATIFTTSLLLATVLSGSVFAWSSWQTLGLLMLGAVALIAYVAVERRAPEPITPPRLFRNSVFNISSALFFLSTAMLFVGMIYVPLMLQTVDGMSASAAGGCIVPLLLGLIGTTMVSGDRIAKTGRYKIFPIIGGVLCLVSLLFLAVAPAATSLLTMIAVLVVLGAGIGLFIQVTVLAGQNAVAPRDLGVATGALNFFKSLGGATGAAVFGAILAANAASSGRAIPDIAAFHQVFLWAAPLAAICLVLAVVMEERPLSQEVMEIAEGKIDVQEY